jgi:hypothetical protein
MKRYFLFYFAYTLNSLQIEYVPSCGPFCNPDYITRRDVFKPLVFHVVKIFFGVGCIG